MNKAELIEALADKAGLQKQKEEITLILDRKLVAWLVILKRVLRYRFQLEQR